MLIEYFEEGGLLKYAATIVFGGLLVVELVLGLFGVRQGQIQRHRAWMLRAYSTGLAVATQRVYFPVVSVLFGGMTDLTLGIGVWVTWLIHAMVAEIIIVWMRRRSVPAK